MIVLMGWVGELSQDGVGNCLCAQVARATAAGQPGEAPAEVRSVALGTIVQSALRYQVAMKQTTARGSPFSRMWNGVPACMAAAVAAGHFREAATQIRLVTGIAIGETLIQRPGAVEVGAPFR